MEHLDRLTFYAGEERYITAVVQPQDNRETVVVSGATWKLTDRGSGETAATGTCEVNGKTIGFLLENIPGGLYELEIRAKVGVETVIERCAVCFKR